MKLSDWADKNGIAYITAYRWFKSGKLPKGVTGHQTDSGTIIVQNSEENKVTENDVTTLFLQKMNEFTNENCSIPEFAAYVLNNFQLKPHQSIQNEFSDLANKNYLIDKQKNINIPNMYEFNTAQTQLSSLSNVSGSTLSNNVSSNYLISYNGQDQTQSFGYSVAPQPTVITNSVFSNSHIPTTNSSVVEEKKIKINKKRGRK